MSSATWVDADLAPKRCVVVTGHSAPNRTASIPPHRLLRGVPHPRLGGVDVVICGLPARFTADGVHTCSRCLAYVVLALFRSGVHDVAVHPA